MGELQGFLDDAWVSPDVAALRPDYRVMLIAADGIEPGPGDDSSEALLAAAESSAAIALKGVVPEELPHVAAWREAYRSFGAKPQRTRNSVEALLRRAAAGLPRVNRLTDIYNAVSVLHRLPVGGEHLSRYEGSPRLIRAEGTEPFDTSVDGVAAVEYPEAGEVVWCDDVGVTCRRWNWRQGRRTQLTPESTSAVFILDALAPMTDDELLAAADDLVAHVRRLGPDARVVTRLIAS